jgi:hypothetical protein
LSEHFKRNYFLAINLCVPKRIRKRMLADNAADRGGSVSMDKEFQRSTRYGIDNKRVKSGGLRIKGKYGDKGSIEELEEHTSVTGNTSGTANLILRVRSDMHKFAARGHSERP